jgi:hypothetical protein
LDASLLLLPWCVWSLLSASPIDIRESSRPKSIDDILQWCESDETGSLSLNIEREYDRFFYLGLIDCGCGERWGAFGAGRCYNITIDSIYSCSGRHCTALPSSAVKRHATLVTDKKGHGEGSLSLTSDLRRRRALWNNVSPWELKGNLCYTSENTST